tara:strand:- start:88 stop:240 length:153 start_codon:yes stop_codon:yes gene_type:complete
MHLTIPPTEKNDQLAEKHSEYQFITRKVLSPNSEISGIIKERHQSRFMRH